MQRMLACQAQSLFSVAGGNNFMSGGGQRPFRRHSEKLAVFHQKYFARACRAPDTSIVIMHHDVFAADYREEQ
ncbi:MAG: hypothetical protein ABSG40_18585 [Terriglobales bacterium]|jgi:hypothetical protein